LPRRLIIVTVLALSGLGVLAAHTIWTLGGRFQASILDAPEVVPARRVALVFGAGYWSDGTPSDVMRDRVSAAVELFRSGRVEKVLFSGDNRFVDYNEPGKMREYAISLGMPEEAIVLDSAGRRTYDSCYRARDIFGLSEAVLVTQRYHLPRALYTCQSLGLESVGYVADRRQYVHARAYWLREIPALWLAWWQLWVTHPLPVLGEPLPIS